MVDILVTIYDNLIIRFFRIEMQEQPISLFRSLPPVLSRDELMASTHTKASLMPLYVNRWIKAGFLRKAGPRSGVYYNLIADPQWEAHIPEAVRKRFPDAVVGGPTVLHATGCQTQIPGKMWFVVKREACFPQFDGVQWMIRSATSFSNLEPMGTLFGMRSLTPEQALEDGVKHQNFKDAWVPDFDDIDTDEVKDISEEWIQVYKDTFLKSGFGLKTTSK